MSVDLKDLSNRKLIRTDDGAVMVESEASRVRRVALAWEALPEDEDVTVDPFDAAAPGCEL